MSSFENNVNRRKAITLGLMGIAPSLFASKASFSSTELANAFSTVDAKVVLLGTKGGPRVGGHRSNPANALVCAGRTYIIDAGMGVTNQLIKAKIDLESIRTVLISHMHSDHELEFGNLIYNVWVAGLLRKPITAFGPVGLEQMAADFWKLNRADIATRMVDEGRVDPSRFLITRDLGGSGGPVTQDAAVRITYLTTPHPPLKNLAYRFDTPHGSAVFSGDTAYFPALANFALGADVLVHETLYVPGVDALVKRASGGAELRDHLLESHTAAEKVGLIAAKAGVKKLVLSHFVPGDMEWITDDMWRAEASKHFDGEIIVGRDLLEIPLR